MEPLELSVMVYGSVTDVLRALLGRFDLECRVSGMTWPTAWEELVRLAIYRTGPDVSQVAAPWVGNFVAMNVLRPFTKRDVAAVGGSSAFLPSSWGSAFVGGGKQIWAIPWLADVRVIYYWRDLLKQAGVDEQTAFQTPEQMEQTLERLKESGVEVPWVVPTNVPFLTLHNVVSWVWGAGGDFVSADGKQVLFDRPEALAAIRAYFDLHRYMPQGVREIDALQTTTMFNDGRAAVTMGANGWLLDMRERGILPDIGIAPPPGPAYVGGSNLVIWRYTNRARVALELVRFLTSHQIQLDFCSQAGPLPVRLDVLDGPPYTTDPHYRVTVEALRTGRPYPSFVQWGLVEDRLSAAFIRLWDDILADPGQDLEVVIARHLKPVARRLAVIMTEAGGLS